MELFVASAAFKDITIISFIDPGIPVELFADSLRIKQILSNFLSNAIKFTPNDGIISINVSCDDNILKISVTDNGIGISDKDIKNVFTAFAQAQFNEANSHGGTGLGLSICHQLAEHMNGSVHVESKVGSGSKFWMDIPVEVHTQQCIIFDDFKSMINLRIGLLTESSELPFQYETLLQYTDIFGINAEVTSSLDNDFDIIIFIHEDIGYKLKNMILNSKGKYIALMSKVYDDYDKYNNIASMCFPIYCSKIRETFYELLNENQNDTYKKKLASQYIGHILIAEDNEANQELIKIILSKYGLTFDLAINGLEAVNLYKKRSYDLIIMDEQMPIMNGNEAVIEILNYEKENKLRHTPVSALTANVIKGARERGLLNGYDSFLGKPIILKDMERVFSTYLKSGTQKRLSKEESGSDALIVGLDIKKLIDELMLSSDEVLMLVNLFINKMQRSVPDLQNAIEIMDYEKIQILAHGIKGSSANFRMENLQSMASEMETMAKNKNSEYNYKKIFEDIKDVIDYIEII